MVYTLPLEQGDNFYTRTKSANPAFETWTLNGVTVIDVTGYSLITDKIGVDGFVSLPVMNLSLMPTSCIAVSAFAMPHKAKAQSYITSMS
jgi:hypothetical protein